MKINIPNVSIKETNSLQINDIALSYVNTQDEEYYLETNINENFLKESKVPINPYSEVPDQNVFLFNDNNEIVTNIELKRLGNKYIYEPSNMIEYTPTTFNCNVLIKKNMSFKNNENYNLKISVIEDSNELTYSTELIKIFADAYRRNIAPANISVNNKSLKPESLISSSLNDNDFIFAYSVDGVNILDKDNKVIDVNIVDLLNNHVNVWLSVDKFDETLIKQEKFDKIIIHGQNTVLYNSKEYKQNTNIKDVQYFIFDTSKRHKQYEGNEYKYNYFANSVLIIEKQNSGFLIVTPSFVLNDLTSNVKLIYETLFQVFLKAYYLSKTESSWITNEPVDYMAYLNTKLNTYHKSINLKKLLENENYNIYNNFSLINVTTSNDEVRFKNLNSNGYLYFYKTNKNIDPIKKKDEVSFLTTKQTVINYHKENIFYLETKFNFTYNIDNGVVYITVLPYYSSSNKIRNNTKQTLVLKDSNIPYYICTKETTSQVESMFTLIRSSDYSYDQHGYILCTINLKTKRTTKIYDIRVQGGGLPLNQKNNYNLIDIGNPYGRPYRVGSTMVITLPKKCEEYDVYIKKEIDKHISSGEYPVIIYK